MATVPKPLVLIVLDGWGHRTETPHNAILAAKTPHWDQLQRKCPQLLLGGSGAAVGLPAAQMGNSEVGHLTMGAGRVMYQDLTRIDQAIAQGDFFHNPVFLNTLKQLKQTDKALHIIGLLSPGGVHSHEQHVHALLELAAQQKMRAVYLHVILDGRDTPPRSALASLQKLETLCQRLSCGEIVSVIGRYYAMDRDARWERVQAAYDLMTQGAAITRADSAIAALEQAYARGEDDEFVQATSIGLSGQAPVNINAGDSVIFMNFRADRARQLTRAFIETDFTGFARAEKIPLADFVTLTQYAAELPTTVAYPPQSLTNGLGEYIAARGLRQLRIAETEKYAHVTFFFNGGRDQPFAGEERILVPSPRVATYDQCPQMSAVELTQKLVHAIQTQQHDLIICNFANADMVGHTGNFAATVIAIETIDHCLGQIKAALQEVDGAMLITADHGNAECMYDETTQQAHTAHTCELVPLVYYGRAASVTRDHGTLADLAPTLLYLLGLPIPAEMTGHVLLKRVVP